VKRNKVVTIKKSTDMAKTVGTFYFGRHRSMWGIWMVESISSNGIEMDSFVKDVFSYEDAVKETYHLNGWGEPKNISRKY
jgi:hypothetical protein